MGILEFIPEERSFMTNLYEIKEEIWEDYTIAEFRKRDTGKIIMCLISDGSEYNPDNEDILYGLRDNYDEDIFLFFYKPNDNSYIIDEDRMNAVFTNLDPQTTRDTVLYSLSNLEIKDLKNLFGVNGLFVEKNSNKIGIRSFYDSSSDYLTTKMREKPVSSKVNLLTVFMNNDKNNIDEIEAEWKLINSFCPMGEFITSFSSDNKLEGLCFTLMSKIEE